MLVYLPAATCLQLSLNSSLQLLLQLSTERAHRHLVYVPLPESWLSTALLEQLSLQSCVSSSLQGCNSLQSCVSSFLQPRINSSQIWSHGCVSSAPCNPSSSRFSLQPWVSWVLLPATRFAPPRSVSERSHHILFERCRCSAWAAHRWVYLNSMLNEFFLLPKTFI